MKKRKKVGLFFIKDLDGFNSNDFNIENEKIGKVIMLYVIEESPWQQISRWKTEVSYVKNRFNRFKTFS